MYNNKFQRMAELARDLDNDYWNVFQFIKARTVGNNEDVELYVSRYSGEGEKVCWMPRFDWNDLISRPADRAGVQAKFFMYQYLLDRGLMPKFYEGAKKQNLTFRSSQYAN